MSRDGLFRVLSRPNGLSYSRLGLAVSRRVCREAAGRNRLKRVVRESFREHQCQLSGAAAQDIVVLPTPLAATISNPALFASLHKHWRQLTNPAPPSAPRVESDRRQPTGN